MPMVIDARDISDFAEKNGEAFWRIIGVVPEFCLPRQNGAWDQSLETKFRMLSSPGLLR